MKGNKAILSVLIFWVVSSLPAFGQNRKPLKSMISIENQHLVLKYDNPFRIVVQQTEPVSIKQLNATIQVNNSEKVPIEIVEKNGFFIIRPDTIGMVEISITIGDTIETRNIIVKPLEAVGQFGIHGANSDKKIGIGEFKSQLGVAANIECCDIDGKCTVLGFQMLRIGKRNIVERTVNKGAKFEEPAIEIIMKAESGDIFIFRQIEYTCYGSGEPQRLDDMIFEIK